MGFLPQWALSLRDIADKVARRSPARLALMVFALVIAVFTALLYNPAATADGSMPSFVDALFTATSAVCVTGLTTVPTGVYWSTFGQVVILLAVKIGGLGVMTIASILGLAVSRRIGLTQRLLVASETKFNRLGEVGSLIRTVIVASVAVEVSLAIVLFPRFLTLGDSVGTSLWHSAFYAISAFNNAGFIPTEAGLMPYVGDWWMCLPIMIGAFIGALGFPVILNIASKLRTPRQWTLHTKLTLTTSVILAVVGWFLIGLFEWTNPNTLAGLPLDDRILASIFAGTMPRSNGFSTVDIGGMREGTWVLHDALMFVGGGSASTAGGIKVTTLAAMILAIRAEARGDRDVEAFGRRLPPPTLRLAVAASFIGASVVLAGTLALTLLSDRKLDVLLFEVISAFATCGLSTGITSSFAPAEKYVLIVMMFVGRMGTMTLAAALALRDRRRVIRYPEERPIIG